MSTYKAIAAVSATLKTLLEDRMEVTVPITLAPPDVPVTGFTGRRANLYLYRVSENAALKNQEIPGQGHPAAYGHPPLSLNLHYLLTTYPNNEKTPDADREAQEVLGDAMRVLHDFAILTPELRDKDNAAKRLLDPALLGAFEHLRITLEPTSLDELSKIWTATPQANFRRSVSYEVMVVQIESRRMRRPARPVETRRIQLSLAARPEITAVYRKPVPPEPPGDPRTKLLDTIVIKGEGFLAPQTRVRLGSLAPVLVSPLDDGTIEIVVPDDPLLQPGTQEVEVSIERSGEGVEGVEGALDRGAPLAGSVVLESNRSFFLLVPQITGTNPPNGTANATLTVNGKRLYRHGLKTYVLVGSVALPVPEKPPGPPAPPSNQVQVSLKPLAKVLPTNAVYPVRVLVNGVQNLETTFNFKLDP
jgi:hypothetical protein